MTRENIKQYLLQIKQKDGEEVLSNRWKPDILVEVIDQIYDEHEAQIDKAIIEAEDSGWMTYEDKQTCLEILYGLKDNA